MDLLNSKRLFLLTFVFVFFSYSFVFGLDITNEANDTCVYDGDSITLSATVESVLGEPPLDLNSVLIKYSVDGVETVVPVTEHTGDLYSYVLDLSGFGGKTVFWNYYANDTDDVTFGGVWENFDVNEGLTVQNDIGPTWVYKTDDTTLSADVGPLSEINSVWISYTINGVNFNESVTGPVGNKYSYVLDHFKLVGDLVEWTYYSRDNCGKEYNEDWQNFDVRETIIIGNKSEVSCIYETDNVTLSADVGPLSEVNLVWISYTINGVNFNESVTGPVGNKYSYVLDYSKLVSGSSVIWNYYVSDINGTEYNNSWMEFYVTGKTRLDVNPLTPDGLNNWYINEPIFILVKDPSVGVSSSYRWDSTGNLLYSSPFSLENAVDNGTTGILQLTYWSDFGVCGIEQEQSQTFNVDLTNPVIKDLMPIQDENILNELRPNISAYLDEVYSGNSGIDGTSIIMKLDDDVIVPSVEIVDSVDAILRYTPDVDLTEGIHTVYVYVEDNAGRQSELSWDFNITFTPAFGMLIESPEEGMVYGEKRVLINVSLNGEVLVLEYKDNEDARPVWKRLCRNCDGYSGVKSFRDGLHQLVLRATDEFDYVSEEEVNFEVDTKKPRISRIEPKNKATVNGEEFKVKYTEDNLNEVKVIVSDGNNTLVTLMDECEAGKNKECSISLDLSAFDGELVDYWFNVSDDVTEVQSKANNIKVDTTDPILEVTLPINEVYNTSRVPFDLNVTNEKVKKLEYQDILGKWRTLCSGCSYYNKAKHFKDGEYSIMIRASDYAGNIDEENVSFTVI